MASTLLNQAAGNITGVTSSPSSNQKIYRVTGTFSADVVIEVSNSTDPASWYTLAIQANAGTVIDNEPWMFTRVRVTNWVSGVISVTCTVPVRQSIKLPFVPSLPDNLLYLSYHGNHEDETFQGTQSFIRGTDQPFLDESGVMKIALPHVKAITHDALVFWESRRGAVSPSRDFSIWQLLNGVTAVTTEVGIDNVSNTATLATDTTTSELSRVFDSINGELTDGEEYSISLFVRNEPGKTNRIGVRVSLQTGTTVNARAKMNISTGFATNYGTSNATKITSIRINKNWWRISYSVLNNSTGNNRLQTTIYPAIASNDISGDSDDPTVVGSVIIDQMQVERGSFPTDPIIAMSMGITRSISSFSFDTPNVTNNNWFGYVEVHIGRESTDAPLDSNEYVFYCEDSPTNLVSLNLNAALGVIEFTVIIDGVNTSISNSASPITWKTGDLLKVGFSKSSTNGMQLQINSEALQSNTNNLPLKLNPGNQFFVGSKDGLVDSLNASLHRLWINQGQATPGQLKLETQTSLPE